MHSLDASYALVSNRDQVYTVNLNEVPKAEVTPSKVSRCKESDLIFFFKEFSGQEVNFFISFDLNRN